MALKIVKSHEQLETQPLVVVLYGQPGLGKTSIACTADSPLLLDFDHGAYRSAYRCDTAPIESWEEVANLDAEDLSGYDTLVIDTGGRALDAIVAYIARTTPKLTTAAGNLTLQGYGELKAIFAQWLKRVRAMNKDVVIIAHDSEDKVGDDLVIRPDIQGGSKGELIKSGDLIGYLSMANRRRVIDFNPADRYIGKNPAGLDPIRVPQFDVEGGGKQGGFFAGVIRQTKEAINAQTDEQRQAAEALEGWRSHVEAIDGVDGVNEALGAVEDHVPAHLARQAKAILHQRAKTLGLEADRDRGCYVEPAPAEEATA